MIYLIVSYELGTIQTPTSLWPLNLNKRLKKRIYLKERPLCPEPKPIDGLLIRSLIVVNAFTSMICIFDIYTKIPIYKPVFTLSKRTLLIAENSNSYLWCFLQVKRKRITQTLSPTKKPTHISNYPNLFVIEWFFLWNLITSTENATITSNSNCVNLFVVERFFAEPNYSLRKAHTYFELCKLICPWKIFFNLTPTIMKYFDNFLISFLLGLIHFAVFVSMLVFL